MSIYRRVGDLGNGRTHDEVLVCRAFELPEVEKASFLSLFESISRLL